MFEGVKFGNVNVDEPNVRVLERGLGSSGEVGIARSDADDQVRIMSQSIGGKRSGRADGSRVLWMIIRKGTFSRLRFSNRDSGLLDETRQCLTRFAIKDPATRNDQWTLAGSDGVHGLRKQETVCAT